MKSSGHLLMAFFCFLFLVIAETSFAEAPPAARIPFPDAQKKALNLVPGKLLSGSLEHKKSVWVYVFEIRGKHGKVHFVDVNAQSGKVLGLSIR